MLRHLQQHRRGFSLLELMVTTAMLAGVTTACMVLVRASYTSWQLHEQEQTARQAGIAVLRHIVRHARQAIGVSAISDSTDSSGSLSLTAADGSTLIWELDPTTSEVFYGVAKPTDVLAVGIEELIFEGFEADGVTATKDVNAIRLVKAKTSLVLVLPAAQSKQLVTASCQAWLRSW